MTSLTPDQISLLEKRKANFDSFRKERFPLLVDFARRLELSRPEGILNSPMQHLSAVDEFVRSQVVEDQDVIWIATRIGYFLAELLIVELDGAWLINDAPSSPMFGRYVVGDFGRVRNARAIVDTFGVAMEYVKSGVPRDLRGTYRRLVDSVNSVPLD